LRFGRQGVECRRGFGSGSWISLYVP
jgi:hypothetical protein